MITLPASGSQTATDGLIEIFRRTVEGIAAAAHLGGLRVVAGTQKSWDHYRSLPPESQENALRASLVYAEICNEATREGRPLSDTRVLLWTSLRHFGLIPSADLLDHVTDDMVVELYTAEGIQLFRNMKFMELCSYTLADIFMYPWWELFERNDEMMADVGKEVGAVLSSQSRSTVTSKVRAHRIAEVFSQDLCVVEIAFRSFSPVFTKGKSAPVGFVCTSKVNVVEKRRERMAALIPLSAPQRH